MSAPGPHGDIDVVTAGPGLDSADAAVVALHGRGATAQSILGMVRQAVDRGGAGGVAILAPQAAGRTWYPQSFLEPIERNQPHLSSALAAVGRVVDRAAEGVGAENVVLAGFSQGACLSSEFVARNARAYGGLVAFSGGLIGPEGTSRDYDGDLQGTPAFLGCSDRDPHIPEKRVHETDDTLSDLGADVTTRIYEGMGHTVNGDELDFFADLLADVSDA